MRKKVLRVCKKSEAFRIIKKKKKTIIDSVTKQQTAFFPNLIIGTRHARIQCLNFLKKAAKMSFVLILFQYDNVVHNCVNDNLLI